jgi:hypothetical protein
MPTKDQDQPEVVEPSAADKVAAKADMSAEGLSHDEMAAAAGKPRSVRAARRGPKDSEETPRTLLDDQVNMPGYVAPGDGPFDTVDPSEHATSVSPDKGTAALAGFGVVNAVLPIPDPSGYAQAQARVAQEMGDGDRMETYNVTGPDGKPVEIEHNIDTGETRRV